MNTARWWYKTPKPWHKLFLTDFNGSDEQAMCYDIEECNNNNPKETEHAYQAQNHQTTKPSHPQDINTNGHPNIRKNRHTPPQFNSTINHSRHSLPPSMVWRTKCHLRRSALLKKPQQAGSSPGCHSFGWIQTTLNTRTKEKTSNRQAPHTAGFINDKKAHEIRSSQPESSTTGPQETVP